MLNKLYKHTPMQATFGVNMLALVDNVPRTLSLREVIGHYVEHQREVIVRRTKYEVRRNEDRWSGAALRGRSGLSARSPRGR